MIRKLVALGDKVCGYASCGDFIVLLAVRLYLIPIVFVGARSKVLGFSGTLAWFSTPESEGGLGLPFPLLMALIVTTTEVLGCISLIFGLCQRLMTLPLMAVMSGASIMVHWGNGWLAIANKHMESSQRLQGFMAWLGENFPLRYNYITELGDPVILNNGMEFAVTYLIMLLVLLVFGAGRYVSADYWIRKKFLD
ncbi:MAG: DoxX family protein [Kistimonas sp.]|nr:DoxX family protein [Kistimonas sp.]